MNIEYLKKIGFTDKSIHVYRTLLTLGPSSVRAISDACGLNRGTTHDILKWLEEQELVTYYHKESKQHFVAESPEKLQTMVHREQHTLGQVQKEIDTMLPELLALHHKGGNRPVARYYERKELSVVLEDILHTLEQSDTPEYYTYSTAGIREYLYESFPTFSDVRIAKGIRVKVIAIGDGGELRGLDERKWLKGKQQTPTYIMMYAGKTAYISLNAAQQPIAVVIENNGVYATQKYIFETLWNSIP